MLGKDLGVDISLGMMFYNEEDCIETGLECFLPYMKDFYAVDMGSTDGCRKIVSKYTNRIYENTLNNNFAQARNFVRSKCETRWLFLIDPDEWLREEDKPLFEQLILDLNDKYKDFDAVRITRHTWADEAMTQKIDTGIYGDPQFKILRNVNYLTYANPVHETVVGATKVDTIKHFSTMHSRFVKNKDRQTHMDTLYSWFTKNRKG